MHVSEPAQGEETGAGWLRADTLFAALCHAVRAVWGEPYLTGWLAQFGRDEPPLLMSSGYPFVGSVDFFPKPMLPAPGFSEPRIRSRWAKTVKAAKFVPEPLFRAWLEGNPLDYAELDSSKTWLRRAFVEATVARVALDGQGAGSVLHFTTALTVAPHAGFHFLIDAAEDTWTLVEPALRWLGDTGLGGKRSLGMGRFDMTVEEVEASWRPLMEGEAEAFCTLAAFAPQPSELAGLLDEFARYGQVERGGWATSGSWSHRVCRYRLFTEGSVFSRRPLGRLLDVTPAGAPHRIYRYALAFPVRVEVRQQ
jgi:CRISPR-associated protein Csm4